MKLICSMPGALATGALLAACGSDAGPTQPPLGSRPDDLPAGQIAYWGPGAGGAMINVMILKTREVFVLETTRQRTLGNTGPGGRLSWSPDGSTIAFEGRTDCADPEQPWCWYYEIFEINTDGTGLRKVTTGLPIWSPDGTRIAFAHDGAIHVMNPDGSGHVQLTTRDEGWSGRGDTWPAWSPDGKEVAFERLLWRCVANCDHEEGGELEIVEGIFAVKVDGTRLRKIVGQLCDVSSCYAAEAPVWSPDGSRIALGSSGGLWVIAPDGSRVTRLTGTPGGTRDYALAPAWSPDGEWIAFSGAVVRQCEGIVCQVTTKIFVTKADGSYTARLTTDEWGSLSSEMNPVWRPVVPE